jgi:hypothetical protein
MAMASALGFSAHTGWAVVVAMTPDLTVVHRGRVELLDGTDAGRGHVYHLAKEAGSPAAAEKLISAAIAESVRRARAAIAALRKQLDVEIVACGVVLGSARPLPPLDAILRSHAMIHTAEGVLYRNALLEAAQAEGVRAFGYPSAGFARHPLRGRIDGLRSAIGAPWNNDHKESALAAVLALREQERRERTV